MTAPDPRLDECANCLGCPDCGPVSSKRTVEAIAHRLDKVSEGPWIAWDRGIGYEIHGPQGEPVNDRHRETFSRGDAEFIAMAPGDVSYLLAELRKAREALARVEALHNRHPDAQNRGEGAPMCESAERNTRAVFAIEQMMGAWVIDIATIKSILTGTDCHHEGEQGVQSNISTATT